MALSRAQRKLIAGLGALLTLACVSPPDAPLQDPPFYRISSPGLDTELFLLGTLHVAPAGGWRLPTTIERALREASVLVVEVDLRFVSPLDYAMARQRYAMLPAESTLSEVIAPQLYEQLRTQLAARGLPEDRVDRMQPWWAAMELEQQSYGQAELSPSDGVEMTILSRARPEQVIFELETVSDQFAAFASLSPGAAEAMLAAALGPSSEANPGLRALTSHWGSGDDAALAALAEAIYSGPNGREFYDVVIRRRNETMSDAIEGLLVADGVVFAAVGCLHVVGDDGIAAQLERRGLLVERIHPQ